MKIQLQLKKYYQDVIYNNYIFSNGFKLGYIISKRLDRGVIELVGPLGLSRSLFDYSKKISKLDTGLVTTYAFYFTFVLLLLFSLISSYLLIGHEDLHKIAKVTLMLTFPRFLLPFLKKWLKAIFKKYLSKQS